MVRVVASMLIAACFGCTWQSAAAWVSPTVGVRELPALKSELVGKPVTVRACLVYTHHGSYIHPCDSEDQITLVQDRNALLPQAIMKIGGNFSADVEATVDGVIIEETLTWPTTRSVLVLRVDKVSDARLIKTLSK